MSINEIIDNLKYITTNNCNEMLKHINETNELAQSPCINNISINNNAEWDLNAIQQNKKNANINRIHKKLSKN